MSQSVNESVNEVIVEQPRLHQVSLKGICHVPFVALLNKLIMFFSFFKMYTFISHRRIVDFEKGLYFAPLLTHAKIFLEYIFKESALRPILS